MTKATKVTKAKVAKDVVASAAPAVDQEVPNLQLADLTLMANIIQVVSQRGAIKAEEMELAGALFNKLVKFLSANGVTATPPAEDAPTAEAAPAGE